MKIVFLILTAILLGLLAEAEQPTQVNNIKQDASSSANMAADRNAKAGSEEIMAIGVISEDEEVVDQTGATEASELSSAKNSDDLTIRYMSEIKARETGADLRYAFVPGSFRAAGIKPRNGFLITTARKTLRTGATNTECKNPNR